MGRRAAVWAQQDPGRVIAWLTGTLLVAVGMLVVGAITSLTALTIGGALASAELVVECAIYVPRAWRAKHEGPVAPS